MKIPVSLMVLGIVLFLVGAWMRSDPFHDPLERSGAMVGYGAIAQLIAGILLVVGVIATGIRLGRR